LASVAWKGEEGRWKFSLPSGGKEITIDNDVVVVPSVGRSLKLLTE